VHHIRHGRACRPCTSVSRQYFRRLSRLGQALRQVGGKSFRFLRLNYVDGRDGPAMTAPIDSNISRRLLSARERFPSSPRSGLSLARLTIAGTPLLWRHFCRGEGIHSAAAFPNKPGGPYAANLPRSQRLAERRRPRANVAPIPRARQLQPIASPCRFERFQALARSAMGIRAALRRIGRGRRRRRRFSSRPVFRASRMAGVAVPGTTRAS
jgi:hypothetical protein